MKSGHFLANESERLAALRSVGLRRSAASDPALQSIARLARRASRCAFAGISIVDAFRQWFAATDGDAIAESSRAESLCALAIQTDSGLICRDVREDPRLASLPPPSGPGVTFYAGIPIRVGGYPIGSLCVTDPATRGLDDGQRATLHELAALCGALFDARRAAPATRRADASSARLTAVLQAIPDLWFVLDESGVYLECSDPSHPSLARPYAELHGRTFGDGLPPSHAQRGLQAVRSALASGQVQRLEYELDCADGKRRQFEARVSPMSDGKVLYVTRDMSVLRRREHEVRLLQRALEAEGAMPVCVTDARREDLPLIYVNPAFERLTGYRRHELLGRNCRLLQGGQTSQPGLDTLRDALAAGRSCTVTLRNFRRDGSAFMNEVTIAPVRDTEGELTHFIGVQADVTQRIADAERLASSEQLYRSVAAAITDGLCVIGSDGTIVAANPAACGILHVAASRLIGSRLSRLGFAWIEEDGKPITKTTHPVRRVASGALPRADCSVRLGYPDGSQRLMRLSAQPISGGSLASSPGVCLVTFRDITEERAAEQALRDKQAAELANRAKSEFLSRVSHEMRTPLNAVIGFTQLLRLSSHDVSAATVAQYTGHILAAGEHLLALINDLLDLQRLEGGGMPLALRPIGLKALVAPTLELLQPLAKRHGLALQEDVDPGVRVLGDAQRLRQVLINIVSNAIKYNRSGGWVCVTVPSADGERIVLAVEDNGVGMTPEQMTRLFQPFDRLGQEATAIEGSGLGLLIARRLVEEMAGKLELTSVAGGGTLVRIDLQRAQASAAGDGETAAAPAGTTTPAADEARAGTARPTLRMLYVEDNRINAILFEEAMRVRGSVVLELAEDGAQALALARQSPPQVLVLDAHLPDMSGYELLAKLREIPQLAKAPAFMCSADASAEDVQRAMQAGFVGYWTKPIDIAGVMRDLDRLALPL